MGKEILIISLDFIFGPLNKDYTDKDGNEITGITIVDNDEICQSLDKEINEMYASLWLPDKNKSSGYSFDNIKEKELAPKFIKLLNDLVNRLNLINDGSFEVDDMATKHFIDLVNDKKIINI